MNGVHQTTFVNLKVHQGKYQLGILATMFDKMNDKPGDSERELEEEDLQE